MKGLIVYYSYTGNTEQIANLIQEQTQYDILVLEPTKPYSDNYQQVVDEEETKIDQNEIITIKNINIDLNKYDKIILGTPVWWYTMAPVVRTFLETYDIKNKQVSVFVTNGGWIGHTIKDIEHYIKIKQYINIKFNHNTLSTPLSKIEDWINSL